MIQRMAKNAWLGIGRQLLLAGPVVAALAPAAAAQETWRQPRTETTVGLEMTVPAYTDAVFDAVATSATVALPLQPRMTLVAGLSLVGARVAGLASSVVVSNIYASLQLGQDGGFATVTLTLPTTGHLTNQAYAADAGLLLDLEHPERFTPGALGIDVSATPRWRFGDDAFVGGRVGLATVAPSGFRREFYARYAAFGGLPAGPVRLSGEISGALFFGGTGDDLGERTVNHLTLALSEVPLPTRPGVFFRLPLDGEGRDAVTLVAGVRLRF